MPIKKQPIKSIPELPLVEASAAVKKQAFAGLPFASYCYNSFKKFVAAQSRPLEVLNNYLENEFVSRFDHLCFFASEEVVSRRIAQVREALTKNLDEPNLLTLFFALSHLEQIREQMFERLRQGPSLQLIKNN